MLEKRSYRNVSEGTLIVLAVLTLFLVLICATYIRHQTLDNPNYKLEVLKWSQPEHESGRVSTWLALIK